MVDADCHRRALQVLNIVRAVVLIGAAAQLPRTAAEATAPQTAVLRIALLVDTSEAVASSITLMRAGLQAFVDALPPESELLVATMVGGQRFASSPPLIERKHGIRSAG